MVAGVITAADFSNFEPKLIARAKFTLQFKTLHPQLFRQERLTQHMGRTWNEPKHGTVVGTALTEGAELAIGQVPTQGNTGITPAEVGAAVVLTDVALDSGRDNYATQMGKVLGEGLSKKIDQHGIDRYADFTALGTIASSISVTRVLDAISAIQGAAEPPPAPLFMVLHPVQMGKLLADMAPTGTYPVPAGLSQEVLQDYFSHDFRVFGLNGGFRDGNIARSSADDATGAVFSREAEVFVSAHAVKFESERRATLRGRIMVATARYAYGAYLAAWGRGLLYDAVNPS